LLSSTNPSSNIDGGYSRDVLRQTKSVARLNDLFNSADAESMPSRYQDTDFDHIRHPTHLQPALTSKFASVYSTFPEPLMEEILPSYQKTKSLIFDYYAARAEQGLQTSHALVEYVCEKLKRRQRQGDVVNLLNEIHTENQTQGQHQQRASSPGHKGEKITSDAALISLWLRCAFEIKSSVQLRNVLWAVLDESHDIRLTRSFVLLARMSVAKMTSNRYFEAGEQKKAELEWLLARLRRRYWDQRGRRGNMDWREQTKWIGNTANHGMDWGEEWSAEEDKVRNIDMTA